MSNRKLSSSVIQLSHGAGGVLQDELIDFITRNITLKNFNKGIGVAELDDGATIPLEDYDMELVVSADGHTVHPLFFQGGNLGILSACGTINDLLMMGATPLAMTSIVIVEEGLKFDILNKIINSFNFTAKEANIAIIAGDSKVMPRGTLNEMIMATTGIGIKSKKIRILDKNLKPGDKIIVTGSIGDHGTALLSSREGLNISTDLVSDVAYLTKINNTIKSAIEENFIHAMKDPTRGGLSGALNEWASKSSVSIILDEENIPIKKQVNAICDMLGLDPFTIACEGRALIAVDPSIADDVVHRIRTTEIGKEAVIVGNVSKENPGKVLLKTKVGGMRFVDKPLGEPIPRIC